MSRWQPQTIDERFFSKVDAHGDCWLWLGSLTKRGYPKFARGPHGTGWTFAHRWCWEFLVGPIPEGMTLDHLCRVPQCVNPDHLEVVTRLENSMRGHTVWARNARKTHCQNGHEFTVENTYLKIARGRTQRICRQCGRDAKRAIRTQMRALGVPIERRAA